MKLSAQKLLLRAWSRRQHSVSLQSSWTRTAVLPLLFLLLVCCCSFEFSSSMFDDYHNSRLPLVQRYWPANVTSFLHNRESSSISLPPSRCPATRAGELLTQLPRLPTSTTTEPSTQQYAAVQSHVRPRRCHCTRAAAWVARAPRFHTVSRGVFACAAQPHTDYEAGACGTKA